jgi:hypothetical protein
MLKIDIPANFVIWSYGSDPDGKFRLLFCHPDSKDPKDDDRTMEVAMEPKTLRALIDYLEGDE